MYRELLPESDGGRVCSNLSIGCVGGAQRRSLPRCYHRAAHEEGDAQKDIDLSQHFPKGLEAIIPVTPDLVINISGQRMPVPPGTRIEDWKVLDPIGLSEDVFRQVASEIEQRVMRLVLSLRAPQRLRCS